MDAGDLKRYPTKRDVRNAVLEQVADPADAMRFRLTISAEAEVIPGDAPREEEVDE